MKKLVFIFFALFFATIITGCNARENTVRFDTNIVDDKNSDESTTDKGTTEDQEGSPEEEASDVTSKTDEGTTSDNTAAMDPVENTDNLPHVGSSAWLAFLFSVSVSGSYVLVQKLRKSSL